MASTRRGQRLGRPSGSDDLAEATASGGPVRQRGNGKRASAKRAESPRNIYT
ncbi:hypothetical protein DPMN_143342 [Dreissena polymorpha]|uniref:Uncharacterized protein n=1 Tax=Dreissena polymorpha TaxID=45954 RepID=A0A9D4GG32_DREPO|nr:hypothetical protein DPMN_143342 [Dreissena polymorpha]